jgi:hypothetical protein
MHCNNILYQCRPGFLNPGKHDFKPMLKIHMICCAHDWAMLAGILVSRDRDLAKVRQNEFGYRLPCHYTAVPSDIIPTTHEICYPCATVAAGSIIESGRPSLNPASTASDSSMILNCAPSGSFPRTIALIFNRKDATLTSKCHRRAACFDDRSFLMCNLESRQGPCDKVPIT